jgi:hypothetical protein
MFALAAAILALGIVYRLIRNGDQAEKEPQASTTDATVPGGEDERSDPVAAGLLTGVEATRRAHTLSKHGLKRLDPLGEPFRSAPPGGLLLGGLLGHAGDGMLEVVY